VGEAEELLVLGGDQQDADPLRGERADQLVDRPLRTDVDAARRLIGDEHPRRVEEPLCEEHLLLVAAGERADGSAGAACPNVQAADEVARSPALGSTRRHPRRRDLAEMRQCDVLDDRAEHQQPLLLAILREHHDAAADRLSRRARAERLPVELHRPGGGRVGAEDGARDLAPAASDQPGEAEDLAGPELERHVADRPSGGEPPHRQHDRRVGGRRRLLGEGEVERAPEHGRDEPFRCLLCGGRALHELAVPQHRDRVGEVDDLAQEVGDVHDRRPALAEPAHQLEQPLRLVRRQRRRGLVHDEEPGVPRDRTEDLDLLLVGDRQVARQAPGGELDAGPRHQLRESPRRRALVEHAEHARFDAEEHVLLHGAVGDERRLLGDDRDPVRESVARRAKVDAPAVDDELAAVGTVDAREDLAERRLPGAVLPDEGVNRPAGDREIDPGERLDAAEALRDAADLDVRRHGAAPARRSWGTVGTPPWKTPVTAPGSANAERSPGSPSRTIASNT
jgi:hypothetical protein